MEILSFLLFLAVIATRVLKIMVFVYVLLSWLPFKMPAVREFLWVILGPVFTFVKKYSPKFGMLDLSPIFVFILIDLVQQVLIMIGRSFLT